MQLLLVLFLTVHSGVCPPGTEYPAGLRELEYPPATAIDSLLSFAMSPDTLHAHYSNSQFHELERIHRGHERLTDDYRIDLHSDVGIDIFIDTTIELDGQKVRAVAALVRIGMFGYCVTVGYRGKHGYELAFCPDLDEFPPPFWSGTLTAFDDLTGDGLPDVVIEYYGGQCYQYQLFRWDGKHGLSPMGKANPAFRNGVNYVIAGRFGVGYIDRDGDGIPELQEGDKEHYLDYNSVRRIYKWNGHAYELWKSIYGHTPGPPDTLVVFPSD